MIYHGSKVGIGGITDGTSNTMMMSEYVYSRLNQADKNCWHWWCAGNTDTIGTAMYAPNIAFNGAVGSSGDPILYNNAATLAVISQSSNHPGGANHLFADGSVKFLKNTVQSWRPDFGQSPGPGLAQRRQRHQHVHDSTAPRTAPINSSATCRSTRPSRPGPAARSSAPTPTDRCGGVTLDSALLVRRNAPTTPVRPGFRRAGAVPFVARGSIVSVFRVTG